MRKHGAAASILIGSLLFPIVHTVKAQEPVTAQEPAKIEFEISEIAEDLRLRGLASQRLIRLGEIRNAIGEAMKIDLASERSPRRPAERLDALETHRGQDESRSSAPP